MMMLRYPRPDRRGAHDQKPRDLSEPNYPEMRKEARPHTTSEHAGLDGIDDATICDEHMRRLREAGLSDDQAQRLNEINQLLEQQRPGEDADRRGSPPSRAACAPMIQMFTCARLLVTVAGRWIPPRGCVPITRMATFPRPTTWISSTRAGADDDGGGASVISSDVS
jgi:hypothetical protein